MIYAGVIPFFHPTYDTQKHINLGIFDKLLRPATPEKLLDNINELENTPGLRKMVIAELQRMLITEKDLNGENISHEIMSNIYGLNINNN